MARKSVKDAKAPKQDLPPAAVRQSGSTSKKTTHEEEPHGYEFGGPIGGALISFGLPILCYAFAFLCNDISGCPAPALLDPAKLFSSPLLSTKPAWRHALDTLAVEVGWPGFAGLLNVEAAAGTVAWYALSLLLYRILPATEVEGVELSSGGRLTYRMNTFLTAIAILCACATGTLVQGADFSVWTFIDRNYVQILTSNILIAFALATFVYVKSFSVKPGNKDKRELAAGGHSGNIIYDWFIGRELNPRVTLPFVGEIDIKSFMELRPGIVGWMIINFAFAAKQYRAYGYITDSMLLVLISQTLYALDSLFNEPAILTTIDITTDGFGLMLSFGDLVWVPFIFSLQTRYLSVHAVTLGPAYIALILAIQAVGYYIFRASNSEKNAFRTDPSAPGVQHLKYLETHTGSRLLISGWWGAARHINYLGDWVMSWAYCLPTLAAGYRLVPSLLYPGSKSVVTDGAQGWAIPITYFYLIYFAVLLIHRELRDEEKCRRKYGKDWDEYCRIVKWRIIPGVY